MNLETEKTTKKTPAAASKTDKNYVKTVYLQSAVMVSGAFGAQTTLSSSTIKGLKMWIVPQGLEGECNGVKFGVPNANMKNWVY